MKVELEKVRRPFIRLGSNPVRVMTHVITLDSLVIDTLGIVSGSVGELGIKPQGTWGNSYAAVGEWARENDRWVFSPLTGWTKRPPSFWRKIARKIVWRLWGSKHYGSIECFHRIYVDGVSVESVWKDGITDILRGELLSAADDINLEGDRSAWLSSVSWLEGKMRSL